MKNLHKKILFIVMIGIVFTLPIATFILMPKEESAFSENENRFLSKFIQPDFTGYVRNFFNRRPNNIKNKQFMNRFDEWFADRFVLREEFIVLQNELEMLQGKTEINGVYVVGDRLIHSWDGETTDVLDLTLEAIDGFAYQMRELYDTESYIMLVPSAQEIYMDMLPPNSQPGNQTALIKHCYDGLEHLTSIDAMTYLVENSDSYIYYRTDHHWTTYGAYWGYYAAAARLGIVPYDLAWFDVEHASSDFRGTLFSKTLNSRISPDVMSFYTLSSERLGVPVPESTLTITTGKNASGRSISTEYSSLYLRQFLDKKDKYSAFMGVNSPLMEVITGATGSFTSSAGGVGAVGEESEASLLIFKDSFAHCMIPFLANHYSRITVLDMRHINADVRQFVDLSEYSQVLFLYEATNFSSDEDLQKLTKIG